MDMDATIKALSEESQAFFEALKRTQPVKSPLSAQAQEGLYVLAYQALQAHQYSEAFGLFSALVSHNIADARYMSGLAHAAQGSGELALAVQLHAVAVGLAPGQEAFLLDLAQGLLAVQRIDLAKLVLQCVPPHSALPDAATTLTERAQAMETLLAQAL